MDMQHLVTEYGFETVEEFQEFMLETLKQMIDEGELDEVMLERYGIRRKE